MEEDIKEQEVTGYKIECKYFIPSEDKPLDLVPFLTDIPIRNDYTTNMFSVMSLKLVVPDPIKKLIRETFHLARILFSIEETVFNIESGNYEEFGNKFLPTTSFKILDTTIPSADYENEDEDNEEDASSSIPNNAISLDIFSIAHLDLSKTLIDRVYMNSTVEQTLGSLFSKLSPALPLFLSVPDNASIYENIIIPPMNLKNAVEYLQKYYGIYENGIQFFYDLDRIYLLDKVKVFKQDIDDRYYRIHITVRDPNNKEIVGAEGTEDVDGNIHKIITTGQTSVFSNGLATKQLDGDKLILSRYEDTVARVKTEVDVSPEIKDFKSKEKYLWNPTSNSYVEKELVANYRSKSLAISQVLTGVSMSLTTPDREYYFNFEQATHTKYNGKYRMVSTSYNFSKELGNVEDYFKILTIGTFQPIE